MTHVVVLKSVRKPTPEWVETVKTKLTLGPDEKLTIVTLHAPAVALAADAVLVISRSARPFRRPRVHRVAPRTSPPTSEALEATAPAHTSLSSRILRKGTRVAGRLTPSLKPDAYFAIGCATSRRVLQEVEAADLVIAADVPTFRAAWLLSRLRKHPAFIAWVDGGARWMADR